MTRSSACLAAALLVLGVAGCGDHVAGNPNPDAPKDTAGGQDASHDAGGGGDTSGDVAGEGGSDKPADSGKETADDKPGDVAGAMCKSNTECGTDFFCDLGCGGPSDTATCTMVPTACTKIYAPVCGCDKMTYPNDCYRQMARVGKYFDGACDGGTGGAGGGGSGGSGGGGGAIADGGVACPGGMSYCPCTGMCYSDACLSCCMTCVDDGGAPEPDAGAGKVCGGLKGVPCDKGEFCEMPAAMCSAADLEGVCKVIPGACPLIYDPVCGCDGKTYGNDCERQSASVSKDYDGACK